MKASVLSGNGENPLWDVVSLLQRMAVDPFKKRFVVLAVHKPSTSRSYLAIVETAAVALSEERSDSSPVVYILDPLANSDEDLKQEAAFFKTWLRVHTCLVQRVHDAPPAKVIRVPVKASIDPCDRAFAVLRYAETFFSNLDAVAYAMRVSPFARL